MSFQSTLFPWAVPQPQPSACFYQSNSLHQHAKIIELQIVKLFPMWAIELLIEVVFNGMNSKEPSQDRLQSAKAREYIKFFLGEFNAQCH
jgi:hypothetical protein